MSFKKFQGTGVAMVTPMNESREVDEKALRGLTNHLVDGGVNFLVVLGTTGESATLNQKEKDHVLDIILDENNGRLPIVLGIGGNNTTNVIDQIGKQSFNGVDAILSVSPYYNKPTQEGIYNHYKAISESTDKDIILYNVPGRTGSNILPSTTLRMAEEFSNVIAIKEASPEITQSMELILNKPDNFLIISGDDALTFPFMCCGGDGVISVVANAFPSEFSKMVKDAFEGNVEFARIAHYKLLMIIDQMFAEGNPAGVKSSLKLKGLMEDYVRLPLVEMSSKGTDEMKRLMSYL